MAKVKRRPMTRAADKGRRRAALVRDVPARRAFSARDDASALLMGLSEVLDAIARSSGNLAPVFDAILFHAIRLCGGVSAVLWHYDGKRLNFAAERNCNAGDIAYHKEHPLELGAYNPTPRAALERRPVQAADVFAHKAYRPLIPSTSPAPNAPAVLAVPLLRDGVLLGVVSIWRREKRAFSDREIGAMKAFAAQAVIAMENARLFKETKEALERETATSTVLKVIGGSPTDTSPVFEAIAEKAAVLCDAEAGFVTTLDEQLIHMRAFYGTHPSAAQAIRAGYPMKPTAGSAAGRAIRDARPVQIADVLADAEYDHKDAAQKGGWRSTLSVPMIRDGRVVGAISLARSRTGPFSDKHVGLLQVFADQAVIAIDNARLFNETKEALERQTATAEILRVISSTPTDAQPVFDAIVKSGVRIFQGHAVGINTVRDGRPYLAAAAGAASSGLRQMKSVADSSISPSEPDFRLKGKAVQFADVAQPDVPRSVKTTLDTIGSKSIAFAPLRSRGRTVGSVWVGREQAGAFTDSEMALLQTFADQAVIAIENARLFNETREALEKQTATADILQVLSGSPSDTQPVFNAIVRHAARLCESSYANVFRYDGERLHLAASEGGNAETLASLRKSYPALPNRSRAVGRVILTGRAARIEDTQADKEYDQAFANALRNRRLLAVPLLRAGQPVGVITVGWGEPGPILPRHEDLLKTFADQAVIAIENVRLFNETKEALERQTATADILKVISSTPTDVQPVFETIADNALRLCGASGCVVSRFDGTLIHIAAMRNIPQGAEAVRASFPAKPSDRGATSRAIHTRAVVHIPDLTLDPGYTPDGIAARTGMRSLLAVPMMRGGEPLGAIAVSRTHPQAFSEHQIALLKSFADQAVIAIENVRLFNETKEALERQTATADVLKVISSSPTSVQPVLDAVADRAALLWEGSDASIHLVEGDHLRHVAHSGPIPDTAIGSTMPIERGFISGRAILEGQQFHVLDSQAVEDEFPGAVARSRKVGVRSMLVTPLMREGRAIGTIVIRRTEVRPFSEQQIALVKTFADQAVIAIENVRLFNETKEALERQTATAEILKVISSSPTDTKPVLEAIAQSAATLFEPCNVGIIMLENGQIHLRAMAGPRVAQISLEEVAKVYPFPFDPEVSLSAKAILARKVLEATDLRSLSPVQRKVAEIGNFRSYVIVPLMREGEGIGTIALTHPNEGFKLDEKQLALLKTFADQAVIAIENVRLFNETKEALERQTATSEILRVIAASPADVQPVFDSIIANAVRLCGGLFGAVYRYEGGLIHLKASHNFSPEALETVRRRYPQPPGDESLVGRCIRTAAVINIPDIEADPNVPSGSRGTATALGYRSQLTVPLMRDGAPIGAIVVAHRDPGSFPPEQVSLLQMFADQGVIAIENVRLFNETKEALERQTATSEILRVISGSPTDVQPVFEAIVQSAARLFAPADSVIVMREGDLLDRKARAGPTKIDAEVLAKMFPQPYNPDLPISQCIEQRTILHIDDAQAPDQPDLVQRVARAGRFRTVTLVPLLREGQGIGVLSLQRPEPGKRLDDKQLALLATFTDQAVIAIENVRLFNETKEALEQQKASADVLQVISSSIADTGPVFERILESCRRLFGGHDTGIGLVGEDGLVHLAAHKGPMAEELKNVFPVPLSRESGTGSAILDGTVKHYPDIFGEPDVPQYVRRSAAQVDFKSVIFAPMYWEGRGIGSIWIGRNFAGAFTEKQIALLKTFADQAVIAIQNARLFREIQEKSAQLEVANKHKSDFLANMSHELRTPLNAIIGFSEVLSERMFGEVNEKQAEYLKDIHESGRHLLSLINDILDLSKIEAGKMELELSTFHLPSAVSNAVTLVRERAQRHGIALGVEVDPALGAFEADERKVKQILLNLLSNAVKFTPDGGRVDVSALQRNGGIEIAVRDTGIGIALEDQLLVFEEFKQVGRDVTRKAEGTGLGLALTKRLVELHGGEIALESAPGKGSTFTVRLPLR